jgi:DNA-3-methyladenine glycosylase I
MKEPNATLHRRYHDTLYGYPIMDDNEIFGRLLMEINQAGLSWSTILKKERGFRKAYRNFDIKKIAMFKERDVVRLLADPGIIRNRLKVRAAIENAQRIRAIQREHGSFMAWLAHHHPLTKEEWTKLFKKTFVFTGGEIVNEFLMSIGYLPGAHDTTCPTYRRIVRMRVPWTKA